MATVTWQAVLAWRTRRRHLAALEVVGDVAGLHAQLMSSAELALADSATS